MSVEINNFLGLVSKEKAQELIEQVRHEARVEFANKLKAYHEKYEQEQINLIEAFSYEKLEKININIWDDFYDDGYAPEGEKQCTNAYIEDDTIPQREVFYILRVLIDYINNLALLPKTVEIEMKFNDSTNKYPILIHGYEYQLCKRWEIQFTNITHEVLEDLIDKLHNFPSIKNVKVDIYSES